MGMAGCGRRGEPTLTRNFACLIVALVSLVSAAAASAARMEIVRAQSTGLDPSVVRAGDRLTFDLVLRNDSGLNLTGAELFAYGYDFVGNITDDDGLRVVAVSSAASILNTTDLGGGRIFGGIPNSLSSYGRLFSFNQIYGPGPVLVGVRWATLIFSGASSVSTNADGALDIGVDGARVADGDAHFRIEFEATPRLTDIDFRIGFGIGSPTAGALDSYWGGALFGQNQSYYPLQDAFFDVRVLSVPEPSVTLMIGLGLLGLRPRWVQM